MSTRRSSVSDAQRAMAPAHDGPSVLDVALAGGLPDEGTARRALRVTLAVLGERLTDDEACALASRLPKTLAAALDDAEYDGDFDAAEFYERVRRREGATPGFAHEDADVALRAIGTVLDTDLQTRLLRALPDGIARHLVPRPVGTPPPHVPPSAGPAVTTLGSGRPGSRHPVAEAAVERAQTHSVVRATEPHADTKLSSSHGTTQERLGETLASGQAPHPDRTLAEAHEE